MPHPTRSEPHQSVHDSFTTSTQRSSTETLVAFAGVSDLEKTLVGKPGLMLEPELARSVRGESRIIERGSKVSTRDINGRLQRKRRFLFGSFVFLDGITASWAMYCAVRYAIAFSKGPEEYAERQSTLAFAILSIFAAILLFLSVVFLYFRTPSHFCLQSMLLLASLSLLAPCFTGVILVAVAVKRPDSSNLSGRCRQDEDVLWRTQDGGKCVPGVSLGAWMVGAVFRLVITLVILAGLHLVLHMLQTYQSHRQSFTSRHMGEGAKPSIRPLTLTARLLEPKSSETISHSLHPIPTFEGQTHGLVSFPAHTPPPLPARQNRKTRSSSGISRHRPERRSTTRSSEQDPGSFAPIIVNGRLVSPSVASRQETSLEDESVTDSDLHSSEARLEVAVVRPASRYDRPRYYELPGSADYNPPSWPFNAGSSNPPPVSTGEAWRHRVSQRISPTSASNMAISPQSSIPINPSLYDAAPPLHYKSYSASPTHSSMYSSPIPPLRSNNLRQLPPPPPPPPHVYYKRYRSDEERLQDQHDMMALEMAMREQNQQHAYVFGGATAVRKMGTIASMGSRSDGERGGNHSLGGRSHNRTPAPSPTIPPSSVTSVSGQGSNRRYISGPRPPPPSWSSGGITVSRPNSGSTSKSRRSTSLPYSPR